MCLVRNGTSVKVIDCALDGRASAVAAGIINPITGHRFNLTDNFAESMQHASKMYQQLHKELGVSFYRAIDQQRVIKNSGQAHYFNERLKDDAYASYLTKYTEGTRFTATPFGVAAIHGTGVVNVAELLTCVRQHLKQHDALLEQEFDYAELRLEHALVHYQGLSAKRVIFCEGYRAIHNPWLAHLPFVLSKGEVLTVTDREAVPFKGLLNWGQWLVASQGGDTAKLGSNYQWVNLQQSNLLNGHTNQDVANKLLASASRQLNYTLEVTQHEAGIRPTTKHREPFIGPLATSSNLYCFNGFGSKGCLTIPGYCELFSEHLIQQSELPHKLTQWL